MKIPLKVAGPEDAEAVVPMKSRPVACSFIMTLSRVEVREARTHHHSNEGCYALLQSGSGHFCRSLTVLIPVSPDCRITRRCSLAQSFTVAFAFGLVGSLTVQVNQREFFADHEVNPRQKGSEVG
jgi:hypothetical protein